MTGTRRGSPGSTQTPASRAAGCVTTRTAVRFVEVVVNGPKSWSLAAELHPDIAAAYEAAQDRAAEQIVGWLGAARDDPRRSARGAGAVPVERMEAVTVRHYTSRAGDPHRHLHLQINARVFAAGKWRGLHTVGVRDSINAINGIGHAAVMSDPEFRAVLAAHGYTLDRDRGDRAARRVRRRVLQRARRRSAPTSTATRPTGAPRIRARRRARGCGGPGTPARGPTPGRTRSCPSRERT